MIEIKDAEKQYGDFKVLKDVNVVFDAGKTYGIIGRNGSGKTVLLKCIAGLIPLSSGVISISGKVLGKDLDVPPNIGIIIEEPGFITNYSGLMNLKLLSCLRAELSTESLKKIMKVVGLDPNSRKPVGRYSMGMRQRLGIAQAIMEDPDILLLDEPMNGLDNQGVEDIKKLLMEFHSQKKTIILVSHNMDDIMELCDVIYYMDAGSVVCITD